VRSHTHTRVVLHWSSLRPDSAAGGNERQGLPHPASRELWWACVRCRLDSHLSTRQRPKSLDSVFCAKSSKLYSIRFPQHRQNPFCCGLSPLLHHSASERMCLFSQTVFPYSSERASRTDDDLACKSAGICPRGLERMLCAIRDGLCLQR
jgi:hypothetical protein